jgi:hypothetical protein
MFIIRRIGAVDVAQLTLKAEVDSRMNVFRLEFGEVDLSVLLIGAVVIHCVKYFGKTAAELDAETTVGAQFENTFDLRAQIPFVPIP